MEKGREGDPMTPFGDRPSWGAVKRARYVSGQSAKSLRASTWVLLACSLWLLRQGYGQAFHPIGQAGGLNLDVVPLTLPVLALLGVSILVVWIGLTSRELGRLRIIVLGVALVGLLVAVVVGRAPATMFASASGETTTGQPVEQGAPSRTHAVRSLVAALYAQPSVAAPHPALQPPGFLTRVRWGLRALTGDRSPNWHVEVGRYLTFAGAVSAAAVLSQQLETVAVPYELCFAATGDNAPTWLRCDQDRTHVHVEYVVLLGANVSPEDARRLKDSAETAGVTAQTWQRPGPAFLPFERIGANLLR